MQMTLTSAFLSGARDYRLSHTARNSKRDDQLWDICRRMGATREQLFQLGFYIQLIHAEPRFMARQMAGAVPAPGNSFLNVTWLRNAFFEGRQFAPGSPVLLVGDGPFGNEDLSHFLSGHGLTILEDSTRAEIVVLGRAGWEPEELNDLIDSHLGRRLQIYSQEMYLSILAGQPDPFRKQDDGRLMELEAFRAGHPGLEYIADGWEGWVRGQVTHPRGLGGGGGSSGGGKKPQADQSPLNAMGYKVGKTGVIETDRRRLLVAAFIGDLPFVVSAGYMEEWGPPNSAQRLRRIADHLASSIAKASSRSNRDSFQEAIDDWLSDLDWLEATFYHGRFAFDWPNRR